MSARRSVVAAAAVCALATSCGGDARIDLSRLDVGTYSTATRTIAEPPSQANGIVLEGIRMSDAVADTSQFGSTLNYLWDAGPIPDTQALVDTIGESGKQLAGWVAGYHATYADRPRPSRANPPSHVGLSITLLRFADDAAATKAASALEVANWSDLGTTVATPLPRHSEVGARYTPGTGILRVDAPTGPFVLQLRLEAPPDGIEKRIGELDAAYDEEQALLRQFTPTPVDEIDSLPIDPDGILARMVATDPAVSPRPSTAFAVYGPTGALRDQTRAIRADKLYEKWGVEQFAVSGSQLLYKLRDDQAARDMATAVIASSSDVEQEIAGDPTVPNTRCFYAEATAANLRGYTCRMWFGDIFTVVRADTAPSAIHMAAAQYVLLATR